MHDQAFCRNGFSRLEKRHAAGETILCLAQVHDALPYMAVWSRLSRVCTVNGLLALAEAGIVRRLVYPELRLQRLADAGALDAQGQPHSVQTLLDAGLP